VAAPAMSARVPQPGDVLVVQLPPRHDTSGYLVSRAGRRTQSVCGAYIEARRRAEQQAKLAGVDAWYTSDEKAFIRIAQHRPPSG